MDFGPCGRSQISRLHKLQSLPACSDCIYECWGGGVQRSRALTQLERVAGSDEGEALLGEQRRDHERGESNRYGRHRPFLPSTHADRRQGAMATATTASTATAAHHGQDMHDVRKEGRHDNIAWPIWPPAYLTSSSQRKGLPLPHAEKQQKRQRETSRQSNAHMAATQPRPRQAKNTLETQRRVEGWSGVAMIRPARARARRRWPQHRLASYAS